MRSLIMLFCGQRAGMRFPAVGVLCFVVWRGRRERYMRGDARSVFLGLYTILYYILKVFTEISNSLLRRIKPTNCNQTS